MSTSTAVHQIEYRKESGLDYIVYSDYELDHSSPFAGGAAYIEGAFVPASEARISIFDQGFLHSDVTYTVFHVWHGNAFRLEEHLDRLLENATALRLTSPLSRDELRSTAIEVVRLSQLREAFVNITITRGYSGNPGERDITKHTPQVYMYAIPYQWAPPFEGIANGLGAMVPHTVRRAPRNVIDPQVKNFQWGDLLRGLQEAIDRGYQAPILLDSDGLVAEGPGYNVAIIVGDELLTPGRNALPGITRKTVMEIAAELGLRVRLADITAAELYAADEVLGCTTAGGVWPFVTVDDTVIGDGKPGPLTRAIIRRYWELPDEPSALVTPIVYS